MTTADRTETLAPQDFRQRECIQPGAQFKDGSAGEHATQPHFPNGLQARQAGTQTLQIGHIPDIDESDQRRIVSRHHPGQTGTQRIDCPCRRLAGRRCRRGCRCLDMHALVLILDPGTRPVQIAPWNKVQQ